VGVIDIFDKMVKRVGRDPSSVEKIAEYKLSFSEDYDKAIQSSVFWRATMLKNAFNTDISDPRKLERKAKEKVPDETLNESIDIITSIEDSIKSIENYFRAGFTTVYVHSTSPDEAAFVRSFGKKNTSILYITVEASLVILPTPTFSGKQRGPRCSSASTIICRLLVRIAIAPDAID
jgi:coenzyme F420-dependent glucose-6-phosphate dehydrogenase